MVLVRPLAAPRAPYRLALVAVVLQLVAMPRCLRGAHLVQVQRAVPWQCQRVLAAVVVTYLWLATVLLSCARARDPTAELLRFRPLMAARGLWAVRRHSSRGRVVLVRVAVYPLPLRRWLAMATAELSPFAPARQPWARAVL